MKPYLSKSSKTLNPYTPNVSPVGFLEGADISEEGIEGDEFIHEMLFREYGNFCYDVRDYDKTDGFNERTTILTFDEVRDKELSDKFIIAINPSSVSKTYSF